VTALIVAVLAILILGILVAILATTAFRQRLIIRSAERDLQRFHRDYGGPSEDLMELRLEVAELAYALHDSRRRWGWSLEPYPRVAELIGLYGSGGLEGSRWLLEHAPGNWHYLPDGSMATEPLAILPAEPFTGWVPPKTNGRRPRSARASGRKPR
jgi:hypothetical protein